MIGISACLLGVCCTYKGSHNECEICVKNAVSAQLIPICPEQLGGLSTPRVASEIVDGDGFDVLDGNAHVFSQKGIEVTQQFISGAEQALYILKLYNITHVILKERSPSCGSAYIYNGTFNKIKRKGPGVATALFLRNGIKVYSEDTAKALLGECRECNK